MKKLYHVIYSYRRPNYNGHMIRIYKSEFYFAPSKHFIKKNWKNAFNDKIQLEHIQFKGFYTNNCGIGCNNFVDILRWNSL